MDFKSTWLWLDLAHSVLNILVDVYCLYIRSVNLSEKHACCEDAEL